MTDLTDADARRLIKEATAETILVEAGAGTGKTTELVGRIVALVSEGVPVTAIAAITFTEKAAAELSDRVRQRLEEASRAASDAEVRGRLARAIDDLDQAAIQTLHSFAARILGLFPLEAGLPPRLSLRDDVRARLAFRDRWDRFMDQLLDDPTYQPTLLRGLTVGLRLRDLEGVATNFNENWDRLRDVDLPTADLPRIDPSRVLDPLEELIAARRPGSDDAITRRLDRIAGIVALLRQLRRESDGSRSPTAEADLLRALARCGSLTKSNSGRFNMGQKGAWGDVTAARACLETAEEARREIVDGVRAAVICELLPPLRDFVLACVAERRAQGELEFHDLLVLAGELLRNHPQARRQLHARFQRILIDEFQDTDPLQAELAALLACSAEDVPEYWDTTPTDPGGLFFVGDPKQSIYRFRRADIELFKRARGAFQARRVELSDNFRCRPEIISWVNDVCSALFNRFGSGPDDYQADWVPLAAARDEAKAPAVHFIGGPLEHKATEVRAEEASAVAAAVVAAVRDDWLRAGDRTLGPTRYADIAILVPTRTNSPAIEKALAEAGVPVRVESRSLLFAAQEIRDLTNILAAVDDPTDDVAVVAALRAPAFALSDADLLDHSLAGGRWDYTRPVPGASPAPVHEAMTALNAFHDVRWGISIAALVERIIVERKMLELAVDGPRPREAWRRLRFVGEQARSLGGSGTVKSLRQFVEWLRSQAEERTRIAESVASEPDDDAVRLLTIHASKGLEFPIVILAGLGIEPRNLSPRIAWASRRDGPDSLAVRVGVSEDYFETPNFAELSANELRHEQLERDRLFYVAATRARERLVVSLFHRAPSAKSTHVDRHAGRRCSPAECLHALRSDRSWNTLQVGMAMGSGARYADATETTAAERDAWLADRKALLARMASAPVMAATAIAHAEAATPDEPEPEPHVEDQPWRKGRAGTSVGRAVHAVLQTVDLSTGERLRETARTQAVAEGIADEQERVSRLAENCRTSQAVRAALASGRHWRELYVGATVEGVLVEGFIDLLYETPEGLVIVDYKTDSVRSDADVDRALETYRLQGAAYALALESALSRPVAGCVFVFAEPRSERSVADLDAAREEVRRRLRARLIPAGG